MSKMQEVFLITETKRNLLFIVTIRRNNKNHNPRDKKTGRCPTSEICTDNTGHHHSYLSEGKSVEEVKKRLEEYYHVTRIELVERGDVI